MEIAVLDILSESKTVPYQNKGKGSIPESINS